MATKYCNFKYTRKKILTGLETMEMHCLVLDVPTVTMFYVVLVLYSVFVPFFLLFVHLSLYLHTSSTASQFTHGCHGNGGKNLPLNLSSKIWQTPGVVQSAFKKHMCFCVCFFFHRYCFFSTETESAFFFSLASLGIKYVYYYPYVSLDTIKNKEKYEHMHK